MITTYLVITVTWIAMLFGLMQYIFYKHYFDWSPVTLDNIQNLKFSFEWRLLFSTDLYRNITLAILIIAWILYVLAALGIFTASKTEREKRSKRKTREEVRSYSKLLRTEQRKRSLVRIEYDRNGNITRRTYRAFFDNLRRPFVKMQNKICDYYNLPETKKWNLIKTFDVDGKIQYHTSGVPVIAKRRWLIAGKFNRVYYMYGNIHSQFIGMTARGKSMTYVLTMLHSSIMAGHGIVAHDIKKELLAYLKPHLEANGYRVIILNFDNPKFGNGWNPLDYPYREWKAALNTSKTTDYRVANMSVAVDQLLDIARALCYEEDAKQPYFWQGAASMTAGAIQFLMEEGIDDYVNFKSVRMLYSIGDDNKNGNETTIAKYLKKYRPIDAGSTMKMQTYLEAEGVTKSSLKSVFQNKMDLLTATQNIIEMTSHSTFDMKEIFNSKTAVFLLTQDEKSTYYPLVTMFFKQLYEAGIKVTKEELGEKKLRVPMDWIMDEFGILPEIMDIENIYAAARSRGIRINTFLQSPSQLRNKYEVEGAKTIMDNNTNIVYLGSGTNEVKEFFSERAGKKLVWNKKKGDYEEKPVITADRLGKLEKGRTLFTTVEWDPFVAKLPPYTKYSFYKEPDWSLPEGKRQQVYFFDIKKELKQKQEQLLKKNKITKVSFDQVTSEKKKTLLSNN